MPTPLGADRNALLETCELNCPRRLRQAWSLQSISSSIRSQNARRSLEGGLPRSASLILASGTSRYKFPRQAHSYYPTLLAELSWYLTVAFCLTGRGRVL
jgi:hypothetical protein